MARKAEDAKLVSADDALKAASEQRKEAEDLRPQNLQDAQRDSTVSEEQARQDRLSAADEQPRALGQRDPDAPIGSPENPQVVTTTPVVPVLSAEQVAKRAPQLSRGRPESNLPEVSQHENLIAQTTGGLLVAPDGEAVPVTVGATGAEPALATQQAVDSIHRQRAAKLAREAETRAGTFAGDAQSRTGIPLVHDDDPRALESFRLGVRPETEPRGGRPDDLLHLPA